jgi:hypothetical protein
MPQLFLVTIDPLIEEETESLEDALREDDCVMDWLTDIPNSYYVVYQGNEQGLSDMLQDSLMHGKSYIIVQINDCFAGMLSEDSWKFLRRFAFNSPPSI